MIMILSDVSPIWCLVTLLLKSAVQKSSHLLAYLVTFLMDKTLVLSTRSQLSGIARPEANGGKLYSGVPFWP